MSAKFGLQRVKLSKLMREQENKDEIKNKRTALKHLKIITLTNVREQSGNY